MDNATCAAPDCAKRCKKNDRLCSMHRARWTRHKTFDYVGPTPVPVEGSILARIVRTPTCWEWSGHHDRFGYAKLRRDDQNNSYPPLDV